ncbi:hypothetical protein EDD18DRAFT_1205310 [Armillaria luteobubalina]|uniref:Uncharacterized protein n=1 Tax=Armillaria luteobubalina TaxID=153913 RepID=A0AA39PCR0_9AGAR|nr:hypothetical protein EDD18DRAFT_1205310 [Armillaria luteobubalina]
MGFVGPSCPMVDAGIIARIGALHAPRRLMVPGEWTVQTLQDLFTPYRDIYFAGVRENRGIRPRDCGTTPQIVHLTGIQRNQVEDHILSTLHTVKHSMGLSLRHDMDKETMDIEFLDKDEADTFLFQFQPILAEQKDLTATAVETANLNPMTVFALSLGAKRALWLGLRNKKVSNDNSGEMMSIRYRTSVPVPYASLVVFFVGVYAAMNALIGLEKGGNLLFLLALNVEVPLQTDWDYRYTPSSLS